MSFLALVPVILFFALGCAFYFALDIYRGQEKSTEGFEQNLQQCARRFLFRHFSNVGTWLGIVFLGLLFAAVSGHCSYFLPFGFLSGAVFSSVNSFACLQSLLYQTSSRKSSSKILFSSGAILGCLATALVLFDLSFWYCGLELHFTFNSILMGIEKSQVIISSLLSFTFGVSAQVVLSRLTGNIFSTASHNAAHLLVERENHLKEYDARNPMVMAQTFGLSLNSVLGAAGDLYAGLFLSVCLAGYVGVGAGFNMLGFIFPLVFVSLGAFFSLIIFKCIEARLLTRPSIRIVGAGLIVYVIVMSWIAFVLMADILGEGSLDFWASTVIGLAASVVIWFSFYKPMAVSSSRGKAQNSLKNILSIVLWIVFVIVAAGLSFILSGGLMELSKGVYGVALTLVAMLSPVIFLSNGSVLSSVVAVASARAKMFNEQSVSAELSDFENKISVKTEHLLMSAHILSSIVLVAIFKNILNTSGFNGIDWVHPFFYFGLFLGVMFPYVVATFLVGAVGHGVRAAFIRAREQFKNNTLDGRVCVDMLRRMSFQASLMVWIFSVVLLIVVGFAWGPFGLEGLLIGAVISGSLLSIMMSHSSVNMDQFPKYIEDGQLVRKNFFAYRSSLIENPFREAARTGLNSLIQFMFVSAIVLAMM